MNRYLEKLTTSKTSVRYWLTWFSIWFVLMLIGFIRGELSIAFQGVTPKLLVLACSVLVAFKLNDHLGPIHYRYSAIAGIVLISAMINIFIDSSSQPIGLVVFQESINTASITAFAFALRYGMNALQAKMLTDNAEIHRKLAEQRTLKARLTPHVLYNMLNTIYLASLTEPTKSSELILALASMMRHLTDSADHDFIDAKEELNFIKCYTQLTGYKLRESDYIKLEFPDDIDLQVPNLLCVTLFENAVTHGKSSTAPLQIEAYFEETEAGFRFRVINSLSYLTNPARK